LPPTTTPDSRTTLTGPVARWRWFVPLAVAGAVWLVPHAGFSPRIWGLLCLFAATVSGLITRPLPAGAVVVVSIAAGALLGLFTIPFYGRLSDRVEHAPQSRAESTMLVGQPLERRIGSNLGFHLGRLGRLKLAVEPGKEFLVVVHASPTRANSAVRPRTSRLDTVPIGRPSISETSR